jgi:hypothetical protein
LLVVATGDSEDVALELIANAVTWNLCAHSVQNNVRTSLLPFCALPVNVIRTSCP